MQSEVKLFMLTAQFPGNVRLEIFTAMKIEIVVFWDTNLSEGHSTT
jgi:hypothetical protein